MAVEVIRKNSEKKEAVAETGGVASSQNLLVEAKIPETQKEKIQKEVGDAEIFKKAESLKSIPVSEVELSEVRAAGREYRELLSSFRSAGFEIKPERAMVDLPSKSGNPLYQMEILGAGPNHWVAYEVSNPKDILMYRYGANLQMDPNLAAEGKQVEFPVYGIKIDKTESGDRQIKIFNYLEVEQPLVYSAVLGKAQEPHPTGDTANDIRKALYRSFQTVSDRYQDLVADPATVPAQTAISVDYKSMPDSQTQAVLAQLAGLAKPLTLRVVPEGSAEDRYFRSGILSKPFEVSLTAEMLKNSAAHPLVIKGDLQELRLIDYPRFNLDLDNGTVDGEKFRDLEIFKSGSIFVSLDRVDSYGNHIHETYIRGANGLDERNIILEFPTPRTDRADSAPVSVNFDLTAYGYGKVENYLYVVPERNIAKSGPYQISSNIEASAAQELLIGKSQALADGAARVEELFGFIPGDFVENIRLINSNNPNAYFQCRNPHSITILDELLKSSSCKVAQIVAQHEAMHLFDNIFERKLSTGAIAKLFNATSKETFERIDEGSFYHLGAEAGHSAENSFELSASLVNSLISPEWEKEVESFTPEVRQQYGELLKALQTDLQGIEALDSKAPTHELVKERIKTLGQID